MIELLERWIAPFKRRVMLMIGKAILSSIKDSTNIQVAQINLGNNELIDSVERVQNFGFSSYPKSGAQAVVVFIGGNRDHPVIIVADDSRYRPHLAEGESAVYSSEGMIVKVKSTIIELNNGSTLLLKDGVLTGNTINPVTGSPFASIPTDVSSFVRAKH